MAVWTNTRHPAIDRASTKHLLSIHRTDGSIGKRITFFKNFKLKHLKRNIQSLNFKLKHSNQNSLIKTFKVCFIKRRDSVQQSSSRKSFEEDSFANPQTSFVWSIFEATIWVFRTRNYDATCCTVHIDSSDTEGVNWRSFGKQTLEHK